MEPSSSGGPLRTSNPVAGHDAKVVLWRIRERDHESMGTLNFVEGARAEEDDALRLGERLDVLAAATRRPAFASVRDEVRLEPRVCETHGLCLILPRGLEARDVVEALSVFVEVVDPLT